MTRQRISGFLVLTALAWAAPAARAQQNPDAALRLRPGDAVRIATKNEPELSGNFPIDQSGAVLLPLVGLVQVADRPFDEVRADIHRAYAVELAEPVQVITPVLRIAVLGEVRAPGLFPVDPTFTLRDVLATAGGLLPTANRKKIALVHGGMTTYTRLDRGTTPTLRLQSGDQIIVARRSWFSDNLPIFVGAAASVAAAAVTSIIVR